VSNKNLSFNMRILLLLSLFLLTTFFSKAQCTFTLRMTDTWGDGWNGGTVRVSVNGVYVLPTQTFFSGFGPVSVNFTASTGQLVRVSRIAAGTYPTEMRVQILNSSGVVVLNTIQPVTGNSTTGGSTFTAACSPPPSPPSNDVCSFATSLPCNSNLAGTTVASVLETYPSTCVGGYGVWYSFVGDGQQTTISVNSATDMGIYVGTGNCTTRTQLACVDNWGTNSTETVSFTTINGTTYYVYIAYYGVSVITGTFTISRTCTPAPIPPTNDNPCNAIPLTRSTTCTYTNGTNVNATSTSGVTSPGCANYLGGDVWYSVVVGPSGILIFDTQTGGITDAGMALYSGSCSSLTLISCDDDSSPNGFMPSLTISGRPSGETIWVRMWEYGGDLTGTFGICVTEPLGLPIELLSFEGTVIDSRNVLLEWSTASEQNNDYFIIERSIDGYNWTQIKNIDATGNSNIKINYTTIDKSVPRTIVYYKLSQVDFDGVSEEFSPISVNLTLNEKNCDYKFYDLSGKSIDINLVIPGVYLKSCDGETIKIWKY
jgi:hypothetical protein